MYKSGKKIQIYEYKRWFHTNYQSKLDSGDENSYQILPTANTDLKQNPLKHILTRRRRYDVTKVFAKSSMYYYAQI